MKAKSAYRQFMDAQKYEDFVRTTYETLLAGHVGEIHLRKHFEGKRSGHLHEIDVAIETRVAQLDILILVECKHYNKTVKVGDVLTLAGRIDDIGAHKGVMVSTKGFQKGATKVARAHGIGLVLTEPVWQTIMPSKDQSGVMQAFTPGAVYIGGESNEDVFLGTTVVATNYSASISPNAADGWTEIIACLSAECDLTEADEYQKRFLRKQYSYVCPFCGERLRSPTARQCESCCMDWHDLEKPIRRDLEMRRDTSETDNVFDQLAELIAKKLSADRRWIGLSTNVASDLGADKVDFIELLLEIEEQFGITFGDDFDENASYEIHKLYDYLLGKLQAPGGKKAI